MAVLISLPEYYGRTSLAEVHDTHVVLSNGLVVTVRRADPAVAKKGAY